MDRADCDPDRLHRTYKQFALVNRVVSGWHRLYRTRVRPLAAGSGQATLLDVGCGGGDLAVMLARWAARDGVPLHVTGVDPDERAFRFAAARKPIPGVEFRQAGSGDLLAEGKRYDVVISNHVLHHLTTAELQAFLDDSARLARSLALHNDLSRSAAAYALFSAGALPLTGSYIRGDGLTSIRRSYTVPELAAVVPAGWTVEPHAPFHCLLTYRRHDTYRQRPA
ncbi:class I SAM-dependent methyltransferase [Arthrobacter sp. NPDC058097]|uniref:class I SAM-dependent methyltransferase n=1 Tax=Arthrobacter sp. NPDC058097 TaxID=3346340 RepID=UPI0036D8A861